MRFYVILLLFLLAVVQFTSSYIWESTSSKGAYMHNIFTHYRRIPPRKVTARKFAKYFLNRDDINYHRTLKRRRVTRSKDLTNPGYVYDIAFIIDSSGSVRRGNFRRSLRALRNIIDRGKPNSQYATITFSTHATVQFNFTNGQRAKQQLRSLRYHAGKTNTEEALRMAATELFLNKNSNARKDSYKRVLLITDGLSNVKRHLTIFRAFELKAMGVEVFVVAVGRFGYGLAEILAISSTTNAHLYRVANMRGFARVVKLIPVWPPDSDRHKTWISAMHASNFKYDQRKEKKA